MSAGSALKKMAPALIPLGLGLWAAFFIAMFMPNITFILMSLSDPFGWGWDLLGTAGMPWIQPWPGAIPWIQVVLVLLGFYFSLKKGYNIWYEETKNKIQALVMFLPVSFIIFFISTGMIVYFTYF
jgi:hypothetical protein